MLGRVSITLQKDESFERTPLIFFRNKYIARPSSITLRFFHFNFQKRRENVKLFMYVLFTDISKLLRRKVELLCHESCLRAEATYTADCDRAKNFHTVFLSQDDLKQSAKAVA